MFDKDKNKRTVQQVFTGLVQDLGVLQARMTRGSSARLRISTNIRPLTLGESIAVMGVCLTVDDITPDGFEADASSETLGRTTLGKLPVGARVHLEQAMRADGRLGGHVVAGHVDATAKLIARRADGPAMALTFGYPRQLARFVASKGSVAVDGVSLTVNEVTLDEFTVMVIPHTQQQTALLDLRVGDAVNVEVDVLARYVARWLDVTRGGDGGDSENDSEDSLLSALASAGYR